MAFQVGAGIKLSISDNASLDIGYRFFAAHDPIHDDGVDEVEVLSGK
jgi:opacity protein-like surface antigen